MSDKIVQLKDKQGNRLFPAVSSEGMYTSSGKTVDERLEDIETNVTENTEKLSRAILTPTTRPTDIEIPAVDNTNTQVMLKLGEDLKVENNVLKLSGANMSNPNLLINGDFRVNQRGQDNYTTLGYTVDRWRTATTGTTVDVLDKGVRLNGTSSNNYNFYQFIEDYKSLAGKIVTFSLKFSNNTDQIRIRINDGTGNTGSNIVTTSSGIVTVTRTISANPTSLRCIVQLETTGSSMSVDLLEAKLEIGNIATTFSRRPYAEELALCQRYYYKITTHQNTTYYPLAYGFVRNGTAFLFVNLPTTIRQKYSFSYGGGLQLLYDNSEVADPLLTLDQLQDNILVLTTPVTPATNGTGCILRANNNQTAYIEVDAEIYS